jgi:molecular chaperone GrpE
MSDTPKTETVESVDEESIVEASVDAQTDEVNAEAVAENKEITVEQELAEAQLKIKDYWDQIVRLNAEMDNHRKRAERDVENAHKYAVKNFSEALIPVCDSMEMGIAASVAENASLDSIKEGMEMTMTMFTQMFDKNGITAIDPVGEKFDPDKHQAMSMQESADHEPNTVMAVMQKGYLIKDRLIRPAMVMVSK